MLASRLLYRKNVIFKRGAIMKSTIKQMVLAAATVSALALPALPAHAINLPLFNSSYPTPSSACATFGNMVSCSTKVLDYLAAQNYPGYTGSYSFSTSQGHLIDTIVLATNNGNILNNGDLVPNGSENAFKTINGGQKFFYTGQNNDPTNNGSLAGDTPYSWDIGLGTLINKLTFDNAYHQLLIGFDMNQPQNSTASLPIWSLVTVRDINGNLPNIYFETQKIDPNNPFQDPLSFHSTKTFTGSGVTTPGSSDFALTVGAICVVNATVSYPSPNGSSCPNGGTLINTNRASNELEFANYFPGLDLKDLFSQGYDNISTQVWMGCFNTGDNKSGPALLNNGSIGPCDTGGFGDIFLMAGAAQEKIPEPATLVLFGATLLGFGFSRRYRNKK